MKKMLSTFLSRIRGEQSIDKLIKRGLTVGTNLKIMGGCIIDPSHCWHISIGNDVILAPRVHILAHDASTKLFLNHTKVANVEIGSRVFIGAGSIVLPGVTIGDDVVIGAGSIVSKNIPSNSVAAGNPAKVICTLAEYLQKQKDQMTEQNVFGEEYTLRNPLLSDMQRQEMKSICEKNGKIFVK
ncbi:MAG: acyltransferase [Paludibacter sp.]|nr:acyltransferase [Paludibacter sp.]